jgi:hypothetical protein
MGLLTRTTTDVNATAIAFTTLVFIILLFFILRCCLQRRLRQQLLEYMAEAGVGRQFWCGAGNLFIQERDAIHLNCYTNLETNRGLYKLTLIVFYYANRGMVVFNAFIINALR